MEGHHRECPNCGRELPGGRTCPDCYHDSDEEGGLRFPIWLTVCIGAFVAGAILYQTNPEAGAMIIRLVGYDTILPN